MPVTPFKVIKGGLDGQPVNKDEELKPYTFIDAWATDTRLMGVIAMYIHWKDRLENDVHQFYYFDAVETGFERFDEVTGNDENAIRNTEISFAGGLGGSKKGLSERQALTLINDFIKVNKKTGNPSPRLGIRMQKMLNSAEELNDEEREALFSTTRLGPNMIPSARNWFSHSYLSEGRGDHPTKLLSCVQVLGADSPEMWDLIWFGLCQKSALMKWFVTATNVGQSYTIDELDALLGDLKTSTKGGGLDSLKATFRQSPLGSGPAPVVELTSKGVRVLSIKRITKSIDPTAILYCLYRMGELADRTSFTISEMMMADFNAPCVSPIVAFGMNAEEFKAMCLGISSVHPDFLSCSFTLGLDEIKIFPNEKSVDDVLGLILGE